jgi:hypothetical protein
MPKHNTLSLLGEWLQTIDATVTTLSYFLTKPNTCYKFNASVVGLKTDLTAAAAYERVAAFRTNAAGTLTQVGATATPVTIEDNGAYDCEIVAGTVTVSGVAVPAIILRITGAAVTIVNWRADVNVLTVGLGPEES